MIPEYIERTTVLDIITGNWSFMTSADDAIQTSIEMIRRLPAADVRPVEHGVWRKIKYRSICRDCSFRGFASWKYCPNCGRQMTTEGDNG